MGTEWQPGIIVFQISTIIGAVAEKIPVEYQVIQSNAIGIIIIPKDIDAPVAVIEGGTGIGFRINALAVSRG